jgi:predicted O-methyltransferase YrrM
VWRGFCSAVIADYLDFDRVPKRFYLYDTFDGIVPDSFSQAVPEKIAFLHLDLNSSKGEIAALEVLFDRVSPGGLVVFDDYGWSGYQAQQVAEDAFMRQRGHRILELPTGQGLLIKH